MERKIRTMPRQTNLAYDMYAPGAERLPAEETRILREPEKRAETSPRRGISYGYIFSALAVAVMLTMVVMSYAKLAELNIRAASLERESAALRTEQAAILAAQDREYNLAELAEYAETHLGMTRANAENIVYIDLGEGDEIRLNGAAQAQGGSFLENLRRGFDRIIEYFC
ncbi:MAG: hypothetical protein IKL89_05820 [Clostridia bacterium]|nr:hypothetical protein [Clostridia bacterium]